MHVAMRTTMNEFPSNLATLVFFTAMTVECGAGCIPSDNPRAGGHAEHPIPNALPSAPVVPPSAPPTEPSAVQQRTTDAGATRPWEPWVENPPEPLSPPPLPSQILEQEYGLNLSPRERAIVDDCPERVWSKKALQIECDEHKQCPSGRCHDGGHCGAKCASDRECGDGFCDRGTCNAIWTCRPFYGHRCEHDRQCDALCIQGRCRSCVSDAECVNVLGRPDAYCAYHNRDASRSCGAHDDDVHSRTAR